MQMFKKYIPNTLKVLNTNISDFYKSFLIVLPNKLFLSCSRLNALLQENLLFFLIIFDGVDL